MTHCFAGDVSDAQVEFHWGGVSDAKLLAYLEKHRGTALDESERRRHAAAAAMCGKRGLDIPGRPKPAAEAPAQTPAAPPQAPAAPPSGSTGTGASAAAAPSPADAQTAPPPPIPVFPAHVGNPTPAMFSAAGAFAASIGLPKPSSMGQIQSIEALLPGAARDPKAFPAAAIGAVYGLILGKRTDDPKPAPAMEGPAALLDGSPVALRPRPPEMPPMDDASAEFYWSGKDGVSEAKAFLAVKSAPGAELGPFAEKKYHAAAHLLAKEGSLVLPAAAKPKEEPEDDEDADPLSAVLNGILLAGGAGAIRGSTGTAGAPMSALDGHSFQIAAGAAPGTSVLTIVGPDSLEDGVPYEPDDEEKAEIEAMDPSGGWIGPWTYAFTGDPAAAAAHLSALGAEEEDGVEELVEDAEA